MSDTDRRPGWNINTSDTKPIGADSPTHASHEVMRGAMFNGLTEAETSATASCAGLSAYDRMEHHKIAAEAWKGSYLQISSEIIALKAAHAAEIERLKASLEAPKDLTAGSMEQLRQERDELSLTVARRRSDLDDANKCIRELASERDALKAKQVAEVDEEE